MLFFFPVPNRQKQKKYEEGKAFLFFFFRFFPVRLSFEKINIIAVVGVDLTRYERVECADQIVTCHVLTSFKIRFKKIKNKTKFLTIKAKKFGAFYLGNILPANGDGSSNNRPSPRALTCFNYTIPPPPFQKNLGIDINKKKKRKSCQTHRRKHPAEREKEILKNKKKMMFRKHLSAQSWRTVGAVLLLLSHYVGPGSSFMVVVDEPAVTPAGSIIFHAAMTDDGGQNGRQWTYVWSSTSPETTRSFFHLSRDGSVRLKRSPISRPCSDWPLRIEAYDPSVRTGVTRVSLPLTVRFKSCGNQLMDGHRRQRGDHSVRLTTILPDWAGREVDDDRLFNEICLRRSELIVPKLDAYLPESVRRYCRTDSWTSSTSNRAVESSGVDLVSTESECRPGRTGNAHLHYRLNCSSPIGNGVVEAQREMDVTARLDPPPPPDILHRSGHRQRRQTAADASFSFEQPVYVASVPEERDRGLQVISLAVRNPPPIGVMYSMVAVLDARSQKLFSIDGQTGSITTSARLDRESMDVHYLRVTATEMVAGAEGSGGANRPQPRSATATVQINVEDVNDFPPTFEQANYETAIKESASIGTAVLTVRAKDQDAGANADVHYSIVNPFGANEAFRIDAKTGVISTRLALDRETNDQYNLTIQAVDQGPVQERQSATASVHVQIGDENDNYPQFSERTYTVEVAENVNWAENPIVARIR